MARDGYTKDPLASSTKKNRAFGKTPLTMRNLLTWEEDVVLPVLATYRYKNAQLEKEIERLQRTVTLACQQLEAQQSAITVLLSQREEELAVTR